MAWFHDNRRVTSCDGLSISQRDGVSVLRLDALHPLDGGEWRVLAINAYGQAVSLCRLSVLGKSSYVARSWCVIDKHLLCDA